MQKFPYKDPFRCPACGSWRIKRGPLVHSEDTAYCTMDIRCRVCGCTWTKYLEERYRIIEGAEMPEEDEHIADDTDEEGKNGQKED